MGLRKFALGLLASALPRPFSAAALSVLLSSDAPAGQHRLALGFGSASAPISNASRAICFATSSSRNSPKEKPPGFPDGFVA